MIKQLRWVSLVALLAACTKTDFTAPKNPADSRLLKKATPVFSPAGSIDIGATGAAEISAYDPITKRLFVVNNSSGANKVDVIDMSNLNALSVVASINIAPYGGFVNSVAVSNGKLAAAVEASVKQNPGKIIVFNTTDYSELAAITVGALPDMVCFSPNGRYIISANEGEPNAAYTVDPEGSVSIIDVQQAYTVTTLNFAGFEGMKAGLVAKGLRIFGPGASFGQDIEPEYVAVAANSELAWVTLQENNAIARIDLLTKTITNIFPLGFKDHSLAINPFDASDRDAIFGNFQNWPVKGVYMPDAIAVNVTNNTPFVYTANEGDARDYNPGLQEEARVSTLNLDAAVFPNAATLKVATNLGRLNVTKTMGDTDGDGDYDELYAFGGRSFSIWQGENGHQLFDSKNELDALAVANMANPNSINDRSDNKGSEPEGIVIGRIDNVTLMFVGLERADAVVVYNITNPLKPLFLQWLTAGDAPEGLHFITAENSPTGKALLVVSNEEDGVVKIFTAN